jgi:two-component system, OmpR family, response regulator
VRILVCDDDPDVGGLLRETFALENWNASLVDSGEALLAAVASDELPDAIVLDQRMPGLTGVETAERLRADGFSRPIVLCSGHLDGLDDDIQRHGLIPVNKVDLDAVVRIVRAAVQEDRRAARRN